MINKITRVNRNNYRYSLPKLIITSNRIHAKGLGIIKYKKFCNKIDTSDNNFCSNKMNIISNNNQYKSEESNSENLKKNSTISESNDTEAIQISNEIIIKKSSVSVPTPIKKFIKDLLELTKFKLSVLNTIVSSSMFAFYSTPNHSILDMSLFTGATLCISMTSQVLNQMYEVCLDKRMRRTCKRPLPTQRMSVSQAKIISASLWGTSVILYSFTAPQAILFSNGIVALYMLYTHQKRVSNMAMHVGALVGALTPILGSYAATGVLVNSSSLWLTCYLFAWQYPHFYGILYKNKEDYKIDFKFISNDDTKVHVAYYQMIAAMIFMLIVTILIHLENNGIIDQKTLALWILFYIPNIIVVLKFKDNPMKYASSIRSKTYAPFIIVLLSFMKAGYDKRKKFTL